MMNLERILRLLFNEIPSSAVLSGKVDAGAVAKEEFLRNAFPISEHYSETELENMWYAYKEIHETDHSLFSDTEKRGLSVFDLLFYYVNNRLTLYNNQILCKYQRLLEWRELTRSLSEDLLTCAYWARTVQESKMKLIGFGWPVVIGHNNHDLNQILRREVSENHFHLFGSAPIFHLSWVSLMNHVDEDSMAVRALQDFDINLRKHHMDIGESSREESLITQYHQAAFIRVLLLSGIMERPISIGWYDKGEELPDVQFCCEEACKQYASASFTGEDKNKEQSKEKRSISREEMEALYKRHWRRTVQNVFEIIRDRYRMEEHLPELGGIIEAFQNELNSKYIHSILSIDYAILALKGFITEERESLVYSGERYFLYAMLNRIWTQDPFIDGKILNMFYGYLIIRERIRDELIQVNNKVGFQNFKVYGSRKMRLIKDPVLRGSIARYAVSECLLYHNIHSLEVRVTPGDSWVEDKQYFESLDRIIADGDPDKIEKFFYCVHFIKKPDNITFKEDDFIECRHSALRQRIHRQAVALLDLRKYAPETAARILAIDAASSEIGCRPEVFGPVFRQLHSHVGIVDDGLFYMQLPQLRVTYHVGEDFLDLADGLRAIDEAVNFLGMDCGDRLGHAIALGVDVEEWYSRKDHSILISKQDYLDNIVWIYHQLIRYKIPGMDNLKDYLREKFEILFQDLYLSNIDSSLLEWIRRETGRQGRELVKDRLNYNMAMYYYSWMIRGDEPDFYEHGYYQKKNRETIAVEENDHRVNLRFPKNREIRLIPEVGFLYYCYHYNSKVRSKGSKRKEYTIKPDYIAGVKAIQKEMRKRIARRGIAIETNPTSNYLIGTFRQYAKHPIFTFYNEGLNGFNPDGDEPQLSVSINTDDMGVFSTSLANEYALIARALETIEDDKGEPLYTKRQIYHWLDHVRRMGIDMSFSEIGGKPVLKKESKISEEMRKPFEF